MKSKHDVKYLIAAMALSLTTTTTLSAAETKNTTTETLPPVVDNTKSVDVPVLAEPKIAVDEVSDEKNSENDSTEESIEAEPVEVVAEPVEVVAEPVEVVAEPVEVEAEPVEVVAEPVEVVAEPVEVVAEPVEVVAEPVEVVAEPVEVVAEPVEVESTEADSNEIESTEIENLLPSTPNDPMPIAVSKVNSYIPLLDDAIVFANFDETLPAVVNYYTAFSEQEIIDFYQQSYGESISQERKRGRLTLIYQADDLAKRLVISEQNNKRQVDVIVEQAKK